MPKLFIERDKLNRRRLDPRSIKSRCCDHATQLRYETCTSTRHFFVLICLKCDELWVYEEKPDENV